MESRIPVPTDNIFKFYAMFGLLLFVFSCGGVLYNNNATNQLIFSTYVEMAALKEQETPSAAAKAQMEMMEKRLDFAIDDGDFFRNALAVIAALGILLAFAGFTHWHSKLQKSIDEMQRRQNDLLDLQIEIAELQAEKLERDLGR